jgi:dienelactone hydrolase
MMCRIGRYLAAHGISAAVMMLPYHLLRCPLGDFPARHYLSADSRTVQQTFAQARSDVSTVVTWLISQPETDSTRIGIFGISLGAIVTHLAMGTDSRINAGVAALGGGDMPYLARSSILFRMNHPGHAPGLLPGDINRLDSVDPLTSAAANQPRHVLMIQAARDSIIPPRSATELWEALGKPPITWVDTGHFMAQADQDGLMRTALDYFATTWSLPNAPKQMRTSLNPPTVTVGLAFGPATGVTPEISWLAIPIGRKADHTTLLHLDLGLGFCGPFADLAITLHPLIDLGYAHNLISGTEGLYVSLHVTL